MFDRTFRHWIELWKMVDKTFKTLKLGYGIDWINAWTLKIGLCKWCVDG